MSNWKEKVPVLLPFVSISLLASAIIIGFYFVNNEDLQIAGQANSPPSARTEPALQPQAPADQPVSETDPVSQFTAKTSRVKSMPASQYLLDELFSQMSEPGSYNRDRIDALIRRLDLQDHELIGILYEFLLLTDPMNPAHAQLRLGVLELLLGQATQDVEGIAFQLLRNGPSPPEIALLGRYLEDVQPGIYTESIRLIAEQVLQAADSSELFTGEFFQLLGEVGNASTITLLLDLPIHFNAYGSIALALLQDGTGIALLERDANLLAIGPLSNQGILALELLAQEAFRQDAAADALIKLASQDGVPSDLWPDIVALVAGQQEITLVRPLGPLKKTTTIYHPGGAQVIYRAARFGLSNTFEQLSQRLFLVDQLLELSPPDFRPGLIVVRNWLVQLREDAIVPS